MADRYLLENSLVDGYLLEDGTGVLLLEVAAITETITAKSFPMLYLSKPLKAEELISKVEGATITKVAKDFPEELLKSGKAKELRSRWA